MFKSIFLNFTDYVFIKREIKIRIPNLLYKNKVYFVEPHKNLNQNNILFHINTHCVK